ncbi:glycoside hydrolase family 16 protein [Deinococcus aquiradiocola]|uniref:glycoside hydrolase family 16 protein n=1 Tax=Deinococcus aquiradiocola TaxID=393059 RepID=UPI00166469F8|nr:glycoside hydrolase family 16 protein [Deinococcus aquiradiocola]
MTATAARSGYVLTFEDDFRAPHLDRTRWLPYYLPHWAGRDVSAARYALQGRGLHLQITEEQRPWHPAVDGALRVSSLQTGVLAGPVGSDAGQHRFHPDLRVTEPQPDSCLYTPRYGLFEVAFRADLPPGYLGAFWMIGVERHPTQSGEICICEVFGHERDPDGFRVRFGVKAIHDPALTTDMHSVRIPGRSADLHVYSAEWTPEHVTFRVDDAVVGQVPQSPAYPMQFMLNIYELPDLLPGGERRGPWPKTLDVAWVRGWQREVPQVPAHP